MVGRDRKFAAVVIAFAHAEVAGEEARESWMPKQRDEQWGEKDQSVA